jgi:hypothetical protein
MLFSLIFSNSTLHQAAVLALAKPSLKYLTLFMTCFKIEDSGLRLAVRIALLEEKLGVSGTDAFGLAQKIARKSGNGAL